MRIASHDGLYWAQLTFLAVSTLGLLLIAQVHCRGSGHMPARGHSSFPGTFWWYNWGTQGGVSRNCSSPAPNLFRPLILITPLVSFPNFAQIIDEVLRNTDNYNLSGPQTKPSPIMASTTIVLPQQPESVTQVAPEPNAASISREQVLTLLETTPVEQRDFILVDTRQKDVEVSSHEFTMT